MIVRWFCLPTLVTAVVLTFALSSGCAQVPPAASNPRWTAAWASAQMVPDARQALPPAPLRVRQTVRLAGGGTALRLRLSNLYGATPLVIDAAMVGLGGERRPLAVGGQARFSIPAGAEWLSDPVPLAVRPFDDLAVELAIAEMPETQTGHPGSRTTSFLLGGATPEPRIGWWFLAGVEVLGVPPARLLAAIGDSITDGYGTRPDTQTRWTDHWLRGRAAAGAPAVPLINTGIGGNRLLRLGLGPALAARFARDALAPPGVTHVLVQIGINDLGALQRSGQVDEASRATLEADLRQAWAMLARQAREAGVCLLGSTMMPFVDSGYYQPDAAMEALRQRLNDWIRRQAPLDGVVDFDAALRDPARPAHFRAELDSGDGLHPSQTGYAAMAAALGDGALRVCPALAGRR